MRAGIVAVLVLCLAACADRLTVPSQYIQRPQMEKIMWEMVQADRYAASYIQSRKDTLGRNEKETKDMYDKVFSYNGITRQQFGESYKYYMSRPDIMKVMFDSIAARGERRRSEVYNQAQKPAEADSMQHNVDSVRFHRRPSAILNDTARRRKLPKPSPR